MISDKGTGEQTYRRKQHKDKLGDGDGATFSGGGPEEWQSDVTVGPANSTVLFPV